MSNTGAEAFPQPPGDEATESTMYPWPSGSFFDPAPKPQGASDALTHGSEAQLQLKHAATGEVVIMKLLEQMGYLPPIQKGKTPSRIQAEHIVALTAEYYYSEFWKDFTANKGLDIDKLDDLHTRTAPYANLSPIHQVLESLVREDQYTPVYIHALRMMKIILLNDQEDESHDLP